MPEQLVRIAALTREDLLAYMPAFLAIAADVDGEYWTAKHFLADFPRKFELSLAAWFEERPIGYAILSQKYTTRIHLHHFMLAITVRGRGIGQDLLQATEQTAATAGARTLSLKVAAANASARKFYERNGFVKTGCSGDYVEMHKPLMCGRLLEPTRT